MARIYKKGREKSRIYTSSLWWHVWSAEKRTKAVRQNRMSVPSMNTLPRCIFDMLVGIWWIIKLCSDCDWYLLWSIWDWCWLCFIYILLISYLSLFLSVLVVSPLDSITLAMWFDVTPRGSSLTRWLDSCLPMTSLSERNMSLGNVPFPPRRTKWYLWLRVSFIAYFTHFV